MNGLLFVPMDSISTLIAEDAGTPELRNPLAYAWKNKRDRCMTEHRIGVGSRLRMFLPGTRRANKPETHCTVSM